MANHKHISRFKIEDESLLEHIKSELITHGEIQVLGLGVFRIFEGISRMRYVPGPKKIVQTKKTNRIKFFPTKSLKDNIQNYGRK